MRAVGGRVDDAGQRGLRLSGAAAPMEEPYQPGFL